MLTASSTSTPGEGLTHKGYAYNNTPQGYHYLGSRPRGPFVPIITRVPDWLSPLADLTRPDPEIRFARAPPNKHPARSCHYHLHLQIIESKAPSLERLGTFLVFTWTTSTSTSTSFFSSQIQHNNSKRHSRPLNTSQTSQTHKTNISPHASTTAHSFIGYSTTTGPGLGQKHFSSQTQTETQAHFHHFPSATYRPTLSQS